MSTNIVVNAQALSKEQMITNMSGFSGLRVLVGSPFMCNGKVPIDYFVVCDHVAEMNAAAREHNVTLIYRVDLSGLGTKSSQNKSVLNQFVDRKSIPKKISNIPREMKGLLNKSHFDKDSVAKRFMGFRVGKKKDSSVMRKLNLNSEAVASAHKKVMENLVIQEITDINITDVSETYVTKILGDTQLNVHRLTTINSARLIRKKSDYGFAIKIDDDGNLTDISTKNLGWLQKHGQTVDVKYYNKDTEISILFAKHGFAVINQHAKKKHRCNADWPKRSFGRGYSGKYTCEDTIVHLNRNGDYATTFTTESNVTQLFDKN